MHCRMSWPDVGFPAAGCSEVEALTCYSIWIYYLTYLSGLESLLLLHTVFLFRFSRLLCSRFFFSLSFFSLRVLKYWTYLWPSKSFDSFFVIKAPPWPIFYFSLNWLGIVTVSFKIIWSLEPPASFSYLISTNQRFLEVEIMKNSPLMPSPPVWLARRTMWLMLTITHTISKQLWVLSSKNDVTSAPKKFSAVIHDPPIPKENLLCERSRVT